MGLMMGNVLRLNRDRKNPVMRVNPNAFEEPDSKTIVKQTVGWYQNTKIKDTEGRFIFLWQGWEDE